MYSVHYIGQHSGTYFCVNLPRTVLAALQRILKIFHLYDNKPEVYCTFYLFFFNNPFLFQHNLRHLGFHRPSPVVFKAITISCLFFLVLFYCCILCGYCILNWIVCSLKSLWRRCGKIKLVSRQKGKWAFKIPEEWVGCVCVILPGLAQIVGARRGQKHSLNWGRRYGMPWQPFAWC